MERRVIYLARHGKTERADEERRYVGQIDPPLSEEGRAQARSLRRRLASAEVRGAYCSDLSRAQDTALIVSGQGVIARPDLREIAMGQWEGCTFRDIAERFPEEFAARGADLANHRVPGGESFGDCSQRAVMALRDILASSSGNVLVVAHAGVNRMLICHFLGMPIANAFRIRQDYGCLNVIQTDGAGFEAQLING
jgi:probable phosphoglycerate mutase